MIKRQLRELQTYMPFLVSLKFSTWNFVSERFGWKIDRDFHVLSRLKPFRLALDIGGNRGQSIIALRRTADPARIISFEPNTLLADKLVRRYANDSAVQIETLALGEEPGQFTLHVPFYRNFPFDGGASIDENEALDFFNERRMARFDRSKLTSKAIDVTVRRLDEFELAPDVIKIDVQGLELAVVKGGIETIRKCRPVMIIEAPSKELVALLGECGLEPYFYDGSSLQPYNWQWKNALFLTPEHVQRSGLAKKH